MAAKKEISVRFLAKQCGVSTATVSRVLNNDPSVTEATRHRVLEAMDEYHYEAPPAPEAKVRKVGVVVPTSQSDYSHTVLGSIGCWFRERGIHVIAVNTEGEEGFLPAVLSAVYDAGVQGVILVGCSYLAAQGHLYTKLPHVWIDCTDAPEDTAKIHQVQSDHYVSGKLAAQELFSKGCKRPIVLTGARETRQNRELLAGFLAELSERGIAAGPEQVVALPCIKGSVTESQDMIQYLVTKGFPFDSVFATTDARSLGTYLALRKMGLRLPEDVKLVGFEGVSDACTKVLNVTCVQQNVPLLIRCACETLTRLIERNTVDTKEILVPTSLIPGQTT